MLKEGHTNTKRLHGVFSRQMREKKQYDKLRVEAFKLMAVFSVPRIYFDLFIEQFKGAISVSCYQSFKRGLSRL